MSKTSHLPRALRAALTVMCIVTTAAIAGCVNSGGEHFSENAAKEAIVRGPKTGKQLYDDNCAACHASNGKGLPVTQVGFPQPLPDFTDCAFNSTEQSPDWVAIAHEGGPIRGFSPIMPAFGDALTSAELEKLIEHVRGFCADHRWPRGELNFPLPMFTEKAFPENETLVKSVIDKDGSSETKLIYEKRVGARGQYELVLPYVTLDPGAGNKLEHGFGDVAIAYKHVLAHSLDRGYILSAVGELSLPTGSKESGLGEGHSVMEVFFAAGKQLPRDFFIQSRAIYKAPLNGSTREAELQVAIGRAMTSGGPFGRQWNPMVEVLAARPLESGARTEWDWVPQVQFSINQRQHLLGSIGVRLPLTDRGSRDAQIGVYFLWDWFDGGLRDGW